MIRAILTSGSTRSLRQTPGQIVCSETRTYLVSPTRLRRSPSDLWGSILNVSLKWILRPEEMRCLRRAWGGVGQPALVLQLSLRIGFALMPLPVTVLSHGLMEAPP